MKETYLAIDFGGGSGRIMAGSIVEGKLELEEIHRFGNRQVKLGNRLYWDFLSLFQDMKNGLKLAAQKGYNVKSIGIDTWGVDFGLIDKEGNLLGNPVCYRDSRTEGLPEEFFSFTDRKEHYAETGTQVININTLFQLYSMKKENSPLLAAADKLLFMPDLFSYYLTGTANNEYSIASTSELLDAKKRNWSENLIKQLELPRHIFGEIVMPGTKRGKLKKEIAEETGLGEVEVIAVGSHDTASAVFAVPCTQGSNAFLSSGTWSLLGTEVDEPVLTEEARTNGLTNEGSINGRIRLLQNITGLWFIQRLFAEWQERGETTDYKSIIDEAAASTIRSTVPVDDAMFTNPASMEKAIQEYCAERGLQIPHTKGEFMRCVTESLALRYKQGIEQMNRCIPSPVTQLNIIGGGCQNELLNQLTANAIGIPVLAGPVEATAIGNILMQVKAMGVVTETDELKRIVINSVKPKLYQPE
ncbi:MAG: rhamnulokinase [Bacteroidaceae bacterium]|nr:rhamnulokinase [Bacteroidaceae bacterium]